MNKARFVIPWYGDGIPGGAELACRRIAENLNRNGIDIEILTTCAQDCYTWNNFHPPGTSTINDVNIRRFKIDSRDQAKFDAVNAKLMSASEVSSYEEQVFIKEMVNSKSLYDYISANTDSYYFFMPYMFGTTYFGAQIHPDLSYLVPCLHDESYAYLDIYKDMFKKAKGVIALSRGEKKLIQNLFDTPKDRLEVFGVGVDADFNPKAQRFRNKYGVNDDFILYVGRKEVGKNVKLLLDYFSLLKKSDEFGLRLVLVGGGHINIPSYLSENVIDLGFIPENDKYDAYDAALVHCQPSVNESFSFTVMESWLSGTPVLVHQNCEVTKDHCMQSNGGLYFSDALTFIENVNYFYNNPKIRKQMAELGKDYVKKNFQWDVIVKKYQKILSN